MKDRIRIAFLLVLAVQVVSIIIYGGVVVAATSNNVDRHADLTDVPNTTCIGCHANKRLERSKGGATNKDNKILTAHRRHLVSGFLKFQCRTCHTNANVEEEFVGAARKDVDPALCQRCHGAFNSDPDTTEMGDHDGAILGVTLSKSSCIYCHPSTDQVHVYNSARSSKYDAPGKGANRTSSLLETTTNNDGTFIGGINVTRANNKKFCTKCHGGLSWYQASETNPDD